jgi:hypothetical protein
LAHERVGVTGRSHNDQPEVVEEPAESLGEHRTLMGND